MQLAALIRTLSPTRAVQREAIRIAAVDALTEKYARRNTIVAELEQMRRHAGELYAKLEKAIPTSQDFPFPMMSGDLVLPTVNIPAASIMRLIQGGVPNVSATLTAESEKFLAQQRALIEGTQNP
jgi:hypothetical protein